MNIDEKINEIEGFLSRENFHAAYNIALSAMNECRRRQDQQGVDRLIDVIGNIVDTLATRFGSRGRQRSG